MKRYFKLLLLSLSLLVGYSALSQSIIRGPYLQKGTTESVVVRWRTSSSTETIIKYGTSLGNLNSTKHVSGTRKNHQIEISGLSPYTKYFYSIHDDSGVLMSESSELYFRTHPVIGSSNFYRFWIVGNAGKGGTTSRQAAKDVRDAYHSYVNSNETNGVVFLGDNAYNSGTDSEYQEKIFEVYDSKLKNTIAWSCLGNHDGYSVNSASQTGPYYDIFSFPTSGESGGIGSGTESYYSFDYGNVHFIVLNSYDEDRSVGSAMYNWAQNDIQNTTQRWVVALWHHPPYSKGWYDSDTTTNRDGEEIGPYLIEMRENILPMLEENGVDLVLTAHTLVYERSYFINGHYGLSNTFSLSNNTVGNNGDGDGKLDGDGAYQKKSTGNNSKKGAVYVVTSTASQKVSMSSSNAHDAMYYSTSQYGSSILEVDDNNLTFKFLNKDGNIADYFSIEKTKIWYQDLDSDTYGNPNVALEAATQPTGYVTNNTDCDDSDPAVNPGATEIVGNGIDDDCDPTTSDGSSGTDADGDGYTVEQGDCDDSNSLVNPGATEILGNGIDDDCNPATSDGSSGTDADGDGYAANGSGSIFSDNFNRPDSNDLGPDWSPSVGLGGGTASIVSNAVEKGGGIFAIAYRNGVFGSDQWAEATFAGGGVSWSGVALRCDSTSSVVWQCSGSSVQLIVMNNGSISTKGKVSYTVVEGDVIRGEVEGTTYKVFINDNLVHMITNPSGANSSGNPGIMVENYAMDDWSGGDTSNNVIDCDDTDPAVNPGATEVPYNGIDDDCDPTTLDDDLDGDGYDNANDCDDTDATVNAGTTYYVDADGDGYGSTTTELLCATSAPTGFSDNNTDCDDTNEHVNPGATEIVGNGIDDDCDPTTSDGSSGTDADGDGYTVEQGDCDDSNPAVNPGATEILGNGIDDDCNPATSDGSSGTDADGDGYAASGSDSIFSDDFNRSDSNDLGPDWSPSIGLGGGTASIVSNAVEKGGGIFAIAYRNGVFGADQWAEATFAGGGVSWSGVALRCDSTSSVVWQCSGSSVQLIVMNNGSISTKGKVSYTVVEGDVIRGEVEGTTYKVFINDNLVHTIANPSGANTSGNPGIMVENYAMDDWSGGDTFTNGGDCDDTDPAVNPGATEVPYNGIDDDCDPATLDDDLDGDGYDNANDCDDTDPAVNAGTTYYVDADGDGYGSTTTELLCATSAPTGFSDNNTDCDDTNEHVNPGATEIVGNGIDDDCDPTTSDGSSGTDADGDGYTVEQGDCDDSNPAVNPGATEVPYNGIDDDCDQTTLDDDLDGDGYDSANDCDDTDATVNASTTYYVDADGDGYGSTTTEQLCVSSAPIGYSDNNTDCDDSDPFVNPGATEVPYNGIDDDCNPTTVDDDLDGDGYLVYGSGSVFSDNFNRPDSNDLGSDWSPSIGLGGGTASIVSNKVEKDGGIFAIAYRNGVFGADQWAEATFAGGGVSWSGVALRCDATSSVVWQCSGSVIQLIVMDNGSINAKGKVSYTVVEGDIIRGEVEGTTYKVFINDNLVHTITNPSGANTSGNPGIMVENYAMDDWSGGDTSNNVIDCDDTDPAVNPGVIEVPYNGIDDDCDPTTLDDDTIGTRVDLNVLDINNLEKNEKRIKIYPNPFHDNITIKLPSSFNNSEVSINVFDASGRLVFNKTYFNQNGIINVTEFKNLEKSLYQIKIISKKVRKSISELLIKY